MQNQTNTPDASQPEQPVLSAVRPPKQFKQYFFEGLMIFIAVSLGFMADNIRDSINDRQLERDYMKSMIEDLKNDTSTLLLEEMKSKLVTQKIDSLTDMLMNAKKGDNAIEAYIMMRESVINLRKIPTFTKRTFDQMQSAGLLRLIRDKEVSDVVSNYYQDIISLEWTNESYKNYYISLTENENLVFDANVTNKLFKNRMPSKNGKEEYGTHFEYNKSNFKNAELLSYYPEPNFNRFLNYLNRFQRVHGASTVVMPLYLTKAKKTLALLQSKYH